MVSLTGCFSPKRQTPPQSQLAMPVAHAGEEHRRALVQFPTKRSRGGGGLEDRRMGDGGDRLNSLQAAQTQFRLAAKLHFPGRASERTERVEASLARPQWMGCNSGGNFPSPPPPSVTLDRNIPPFDERHVYSQMLLPHSFLPLENGATIICCCCC